MRYTIEMRWFFVVITLGACAPHAASGPAWPKAAASDKDGGESLAPQESRQVAVAVEKSEEAKPVAATEAKPAAAAPASEAPAGGAGPVAPTAPIDETIMTEDVIIEIDD
ncbi:MAG: hypothetical protein JWO36_3646 [Myxococcales bacterium]|nr:hypothetical protein [Myxococcales bacterium]